jgi:hypothetical protein
MSEGCFSKYSTTPLSSANTNNLNGEDECAVNELNNANPLDK